jgi:hypothetical protein
VGSDPAAAAVAEHEVEQTLLRTVDEGRRRLARNTSALHTGHAPFGCRQWAQTAGWAALGNIVGGVGLVTVLRLLPVPHKVREERARPALGVPIGDYRRMNDGQTD